MHRVFLAALAVLCLTGLATADEVTLTDGTRIVGKVQQVYADKAVIKTDFAGELKIDASKIRAVSTTDPVVVQLKSGERFVGPLVVGADGGVTVKGTDGTSHKVEVSQLTALWLNGQDSPDVTAMKAKLNIKPWSYHVELGINGQTGNSENVSINGRANATYKTEIDNLVFYIMGRYAHDNGRDTARQIVGGIDFEHNITDRFYWFGHAELENDETQNLDLRATVTAGLGYMVIKEPDLSWKVRGGPGYEHDSYSDGTVKDSAVMELAEFLNWKVVPWFSFDHSIHYYPTFDSLTDFRVVMENAGTLPLNKEATWKLHLGVRNEYTSEPRPGFKRLDTWYFLNLGYDF